MGRIEVTVRFDFKGNVIPISFIYKGRTYRVDSIGRRWTADDGLHMLVMDIRNQAYHLLFTSETSVWYLIRGEKAQTVPFA